jgi:subtilisin family serine protease
MMKSVLLLSALVATALAMAPLHKGDGSGPENDFVVVFHRNSTLEGRQKHMNMLGQQLDTESKITRNYNFQKFFGYAGTFSPATLEFIRSDEGVVEFVEQDQVATATVHGETNKNINLYPNGEDKAKKAERACATQREATWGLVRTAERDLRIDGVFNHDNEAGRNVEVYILDTGIYTEHTEFEGRAVWGFDAINNPSPRTDQNGHGTHCAGTSGSKSYGVAKSATLVAVQVLSATGSGSFAAVIEGIDWTAKDHTTKRNVCVANMSLGGGYSLALNRAVEEAIAAGCTFALAAGNENNNACFSSPASAPDGLTVSSSDNSDRRSSFSNYGECSNIYAPGSSITSTWIGSPYAINTISGTSMAAPHAAGVAAAILTENPTLTPSMVASLMSTTSTKDKLTDVQGTPNEIVYATCAKEE